MEIASVIISVIALLASLGCLVIMLAKNYFSTHTVQLQPVNPMAEFMNTFSPEMGKTGNPYREIDDPLDDQEAEYLSQLKKKPKI